MTRLTLGDLLDPAGFLKRREAEERNTLKAAELSLKAEIAGAQLTQGARHHRENLELGHARLDLDAQIESRKLSQDDQHHADKLAVLDRSHSLEVRKFELSETRDTAEIALGRDRLSFEKESAMLSAETARDTAIIGADASRDVARIGQDGALALAQQNHSNALDLAREQAHLDIISKARGVAYDSIASSLRRGEDTNRAVSSAYADIMTEKVRGRVARKFEDQKEKHRSAERSHEIVMACLQNRHRNDELTHSEVTRLAVRLIERASSGQTPPTQEEVDAWIDAAKRSGII